MRVAILANRANSFYRPLAEGLERMFKEIGVEAILLYDGLESLPRKQLRGSGKGANWKGKVFQLAEGCAAWLNYQRLLRCLRTVDVAVIVGHMPRAFYDLLFDDERLRRDVPRLPILLYDLVYLGSRNNWVKWIHGCVASKRVPKGNHWGTNRYDHHLCITEVSEYPVLPGAESYSRIGINLIDPSLAIEPREICALIDFERPNHLPERAIQIQACLEAGIPFKVLHDSYSMAEIRKIYRSCSLYFIAHTESFGLPICEVQACGGVILTPYANWCHAHFFEAPESGQGGRLPENFIVYNNDKQQLVSELERLKRDYNAETALGNFKRDQPHFHRGNPTELARVVAMIGDGTIHSTSHQHHPTLQQLSEAVDARS
ncbi:MULTISPECIES: glycosyltransferase [unclassified Synechococcus]|uniref:glycosyltransferase n=1 Tax=unclassified Synechococcus TaxID=2626047 RepID=UPI001C251389|nr:MULTISPECIES: glycosyltransferase [unclassified Synechococcus]